MLALALLACGGAGPRSAPVDTDPIDTDESLFGLDAPEAALPGTADPVTDADAWGSRLCLAGDTVYVLFLEEAEDELHDALYVTASTDRGLTWPEAPTRLGVDTDVSNPDLSCDASGVTVVWEDERDGDDHRIHANRSVDGGATWLADDVRIDDDLDGPSMSLEPRLAAGGGGLVVAWYDNRDGAYDIFVARSDDGGATWSPPVRVESDAPGADYSARPQVAMSDDGTEVAVVWEDARNGRTDIYAARSVDGGLSFEPDVRLDTGDDAGASDAFEPVLCSDGQGELYAVWHDSRSPEDDDRDVYASWSDDGGQTWLPTDVRVDTPGVDPANALFPACVLVDGTLHVAWQDIEEGAYDIYHRALVDGVPQGTDARLDRGDPAGSTNSLDAAITTDGTDLVVAWRDGRSDLDGRGYDDLFFNAAPVGETFDTTDHALSTLEGGASFKVDLDIAVSDGELFAVWIDGRNGNSDVFFRRVSLP